MSDTLLTDLQADIAERLRADEVLAGITVITERSADPASERDRALGLVSSATENRRGLCLVVMQLSAAPETLEAPGPLLVLRPTVRVMESPLNNASGMVGLTIARRVGRILHHYQPAGIASVLLADSGFIAPVDDPIAPVAYDVAFTCREAENEIWSKVTAPAVSASSASAPATVTMTCPTDGASIYWTADGTMPRPGGATSTLYASPFSVPSAALIRAAAYAAGSIASDTTALRLL